MSAIFTLLFVTQIVFSYSALTPINKCKITDNSCLRTVAQAAVLDFTAGLPEAGTEPLDPMSVDLINVDLSGLKLAVRDSTIKGMKKAVIDKLSIDMTRKVIKLTFHLDINLKGKYKASGRLLILPISGEGDSIIKLKNLEVDMTMPFDMVKNADGKDIIQLKSFKYVYDVKDNAHFQLTNLFNGNQPLSDTMHRFMNENWKALTQEFGVPMLNKPTNKIFTAIKTYLSTQPIEDIANL